MKCPVRIQTRSMARTFCNLVALVNWILQEMRQNKQFGILREKVVAQNPHHEICSHSRSSPPTNLTLSSFFCVHEYGWVTLTSYWKGFPQVWRGCCLLRWGNWSGHKTLWQLAEMATAGFGWWCLGDQAVHGSKAGFGKNSANSSQDPYSQLAHLLTESHTNEQTLPPAPVHWNEPASREIKKIM